MIHGYSQNATVSLFLQWHHITGLYLVAHFLPVWSGSAYETVGVQN